MKTDVDWTREFARPQVRNTLAKVIDESTPGLIDRLGNDPKAYADLIAVTHLVAEEADELLRETVISARHAGLNWEQIGEVLGISRQAAQQKFSAPAGERSRESTREVETEGPVNYRAADYGDIPPVGTQVTVDFGWTGTASEDVGFLNRAGNYGWHGISCSSDSWILEFDNRQWQHISTFGKPPFGDGWQRICRYGWSVYWSRPTNLPILPGSPDPHAFKSQRKLEKELKRKAGIVEPTTIEKLVATKFLTIEREQ